MPDPASVIPRLPPAWSSRADRFLSTINRNPRVYLFAVIGAGVTSSQLLPRGTHDFRKLHPSVGTRRLVARGRSQVKDIIGLTYNPLTKHQAGCQRRRRQLHGPDHGRREAHAAQSGTVQHGWHLARHGARTSLPSPRLRVPRPAAGGRGNGCATWSPAAHAWVAGLRPVAGQPELEPCARNSSTATRSIARFSAGPTTASPNCSRRSRAGLIWGVVTNKPVRFAEPIMKRLGYAERSGC